MAWSPEQTGALYERHKSRWRMEQDFSEMTLDVLRDGTYLPAFSAKEAPLDHDYRKKMSAPLDICRDAVRIRIDNIWRKPVDRSAEGSKYAHIIEPLIHNADNDGTSLDQFMRTLVWQYYVTGADIVTQVAKAPEGGEVISEADRKRYGIQPYFMQFSPLDRYDWAMRGNKTFAWARYCLGTVPPADEQYDKDATVTEFLTVFANGWRKHTVKKRTGNDTSPEISKEESPENARGEQALGIPPIIKAYFSESQKSGQAGVPLSLLTRPAVIAYVILNLKSQADAELLAAVPRFYATGLAGEEVPDTYAPGMLVKFLSENAKITVAQGLVGHITEKREWLLFYIGEILRLLKFRGGMAEIAAHSGSGLKLAIERTDLDNELRATAGFLESLELEMMRHAVVLSTGKEIPPERAAEELGYSAKYNRDFMLEPLGEMLDNLGKWITKCGNVADITPEFTKEMVRQLRNMLVRDDSQAAEVIDAELEEADFTGGAEPEGEEPPQAPPDEIAKERE